MTTPNGNGMTSLPVFYDPNAPLYPTAAPGQQPQEQTAAPGQQPQEQTAAPGQQPQEQTAAPGQQPQTLAQVRQNLNATLQQGQADKTELLKNIEQQGQTWANQQIANNIDRNYVERQKQQWVADQTSKLESDYNAFQASLARDFHYQAAILLAEQSGRPVAELAAMQNVEAMENATRSSQQMAGLRAELEQIVGEAVARAMGTASASNGAPNGQPAAQQFVPPGAGAVSGNINPLLDYASGRGGPHSRSQPATGRAWGLTSNTELHWEVNDDYCIGSARNSIRRSRYASSDCGGAKAERVDGRHRKAAGAAHASQG